MDLERERRLFERLLSGELDCELSEVERSLLFSLDLDRALLFSLDLDRREPLSRSFPLSFCRPSWPEEWCSPLLLRSVSELLGHCSADAWTLFLLAPDSLDGDWWEDLESDFASAFCFFLLGAEPEASDSLQAREVLG